MTPPGGAMSWSPANQDRAKKLLANYPERRSAVMPLLYLSALEHGYASDDAIRDVADLTGLTSAQVNSVASFYEMYKRHPVGQYLVSVCTSISCFLLGSDEVLEAIETETATPDGETSQDGLFSVEHVECTGACAGAPAVLVNYELIEGVQPDKAGALCRWLCDARPSVVVSDEMQELFGSNRSFDWGISDRTGAVAPVPAFQPLGSAGSDTAAGTNR